jgi:hypothetical protein
MLFMIASELRAFAQINYALPQGRHVAQGNLDHWKKICAIVFATSHVLACATKPWMGIKMNGDKVIQVGRYHSLDACRKDVAKAGGNWCGKDCKTYGQASVADCKPLIPVP